MHVIRMAEKRIEFRSRESIEALRSALDQAEREGAEGVTILIKPPGKPEDIVVAGTYRKEPAKAANSAMRLCLRLAQMQDELDSANHG